MLSPLLSNLYLITVDRMLERAKEVTRHGPYTCLEYARFADDLVILVDTYPQHDGLLKAVDRRLREETGQAPGHHALIISDELLLPHGFSRAGRKILHSEEGRPPA